MRKKLVNYQNLNKKVVFIVLIYSLTTVYHTPYYLGCATLQVQGNLENSGKES